MLVQLLGVTGIAALVLSGLLAANLLRDRGVDPRITRRIAGALGGGVYLVAVLALDAWTAVAVSGVLTLAVLSLRLFFKRQVRGLAGAASGQRWAEIAYPLAGTISLVI